MIRNLASYRVGTRILIHRDYTTPVEVEILEKGRRALKIKALSGGWWPIGSIQWIKTCDWTILQVLHQSH
jgi:hypothetical protein